LKIGNQDKRKKIHFGNKQSYKELIDNEREKGKCRNLETERKKGENEG